LWKVLDHHRCPRISLKAVKLQIPFLWKGVHLREGLSNAFVFSKDRTSRQNLFNKVLNGDGLIPRASDELSDLRELGTNFAIAQKRLQKRLKFRFRHLFSH
jgi:hypothetical protein